MSKTYEFQTETSRLLELMIHSLYSNKDVFLRELVSNASDALDKRRFLALTDVSLLGDTALTIDLEVDPDKRTLTISDTGVGMSHDEVVQNIGTIARSGTREFGELLAHKKDLAEHPELIGQFGVGFYSSFLVAKRVTLDTRKVGEETSTRWESDGTGTYTISDGLRKEPGTTITLELRDANAEEGLQDYCEPWVLHSLIRKYSDFVAYPIRMKKDGKDELETLNTQKAIWTRPAEEVENSELDEFYKHISRDWTAPMARISTSIEGTFEARALLFIPQRAPFDLHHREMNRRGIQLYVKRVFVMDECNELLPVYLRFVKGVVDSEDLPLNVSREILQDNGQVRAIRKHLVKKILDKLSAVLAEDREAYATFWSEFGAALKEGLLMGPHYNPKLLDLVLADSTRDQGKTTLAEYVQRMGEKQEDIYYLTGTSAETLRKSPHLEALVARGVEVLLFTDPVDEIWLQQNPTFQDKKLVLASQGELALDEEGTKDAKTPEIDPNTRELLLVIRSALQDTVKDVRASQRLTQSAACLVTDKGDMTPQMEQLMRATGRELPAIKRILEVNANHPVLEAMSKRFAQNAADATLRDYAELLYGQALLGEGGQLPDPARFAALVSQVMVAAATGA